MTEPTWKRVQREAREADERRQGQKKRVVYSAALLALKPGDRVYYMPKRMDVPHAGEQVTVARGPRRDVRNATVRLRFPTDEQRTVPLSQVSLTAPSDDVAPFVQEARRMPGWKRLLEVVGLAQAAHAAAAAEVLKDGEETDVPELGPFLQQAEERARQMAGTVAARAQRKALAKDLAVALLRAAQEDATAAAAKRGGRGGKGAVPAPSHLPVPTEEAARAQMTQEHRAMINRIALSIHRRWFLSDAELLAVSEEEREERRIQGTLRQIIALGERETGSPHTQSAEGPRKGNALHGDRYDHLLRATQLGSELATAVLAGHTDQALTLALMVREHRLQYLVATKAMNRTRIKHGSGRYFHGDVLSVREEHAVHDADGVFIRYDGMTQYYVRLIVLYGPDGHTLEVANHEELEAVTGTAAGLRAWGSLCRWMVDLSERADGRQPGRRQDDDEALIYRDHDGHLEARASLKGYPDLLLAFEVLRRALEVELPAQDITSPELGEAPLPGFHPPLEPDSKNQGSVG
ncbi:hypothetical protein GO986_08960 [Deinococcus sp. HMF7620]|uniref:Uncharacterized protein n=1 Tax=Deinococcus arboris TaxID=2682977 RepID=A0A7C9HRJ6_9DEIO|nr:hypothetical protein [Deinococcus arboris]MVN86893.1 hypothetical protein [Deinococcus arboris]